MNDFYLAGFFDGEGCAFIRKSKKIKVKKNGEKSEYLEFQPQIIFTNTNREIIEKIASYFDTKIYENKYNGPGDKIGYFTLFTGKKMFNLANSISDKVTVKREQIKILIELHNLRKVHNKRSEDLIKKQEDCHTRIRILNKRGKKV